MTTLSLTASKGPLLVALALGTLMACSGKHSAPQAPTLTYSNPSSDGFCLVKQTTSTPERLVLGLQGPNGTAIRGALVSPTVDGTRVSWAPFEGTSYVQEGGALDMGSGIKLLRGQVSGNTLEAAAFQKGTTSAATLGANPILRIALTLKQGATRGPVILAAGSAQILDAQGNTQTVPVAVGTLNVE